MLTVVGATFWDYLLGVEGMPIAGAMNKAQFLRGNPAGCVPNSAAQIAMLGVDVTLISRVGDDSLGHCIQESCSEMPHLHTLWLPSHGPTRMCLVLTTPDGERTLIPVSNPESLGEKVIYNDDVERQLGDTSLLWIMQGDADERWHYAKKAKESSAQIGLPLQHFASEVACGRAQHWDIIVGSIDDISSEDIPSLDSLISTSLCIITHGAEGGRYSQYGRPWQRFSAEKVTDLVDTCGAGDAFLGGVLAGLYQGMPAQEAVQQGVACGAKAVARLGSWPV